MGKFHGQRSLAGYSPWGCKESDTTERLTLEYIMLTLNKAVTKEQILYDSTCMKYLIKFIETESRIGVYQGLVRRKNRELSNRYRISVFTQ